MGESIQESLNEKRKQLWRPHYLYMIGIFYIFQGFYSIGEMLYIPFFLVENGFDTAEITAMISIIAIPEFFKMIAGLISDRLPVGKFGRRRPYIIMAGLLYLPIFGILAFIQEFSVYWTILLILGRIVWVFCDGILDALAVEITPTEYTGRVQGFGTGGRMFGTIIGSLFIGNFAETNGWKMALIVIGIGAAMQAFVAFVIKEPMYTRDKLTPIGIIFKRSLGKARPWLGLIFVLCISGLTGIYNVATSYSADGLGLSESVVGNITAIFAVVAFIVALLGGFIVDKLGTKKSTIIFGIAHWIFILPWLWVRPGVNITYIYLAAATLGTTFSLLRIPTYSIAMQVCEPEFEGFMFSAFTSFSNIGATVFGSLIVGQLTGYMLPGVAFYTMFPLFLLGMLMLWLITKKKK